MKKCAWLPSCTCTCTCLGTWFSVSINLNSFETTKHRRWINYNLEKGKKKGITSSFVGIIILILTFLSTTNSERPEYQSVSSFRTETNLPVWRFNKSFISRGFQLFLLALVFKVFAEIKTTKNYIILKVQVVCIFIIMNLRII